MKRVTVETVSEFYARTVRAGRAVLLGSHERPESWIARLRPVQGAPRYFLAFSVNEVLRELSADQPVPRYSVNASPGWRAAQRRKGAAA